MFHVIFTWALSLPPLNEPSVELSQRDVKNSGLGFDSFYIELKETAPDRSGLFELIVSPHIEYIFLYGGRGYSLPPSFQRDLTTLEFYQ